MIDNPDGSPSIDGPGTPPDTAESVAPSRDGESTATEVEGSAATTTVETDSSDPPEAAEPETVAEVGDGSDMLETEATAEGDESRSSESRDGAPSEEPSEPDPSEPEEDDRTSLQEDERASEARLNEIHSALSAGFDRVLDAFDGKLRFDASKQEQLDRLHEELQGHRSDLVGRVANPLLMGLIQLHDAIDKLVEDLENSGEDTYDAARVYELLRYQQSDIEILLENHGVTTYAGIESKFDRARQQALEAIVTEDPDAHGSVIDQVRVGFERGDAVVRKEKVRVAKFIAPTESGQTPEQEPAEASGTPTTEPQESGDHDVGPTNRGEE